MAERHHTLQSLQILPQDTQRSDVISFRQKDQHDRSGKTVSGQLVIIIMLQKVQLESQW